MKLHHLRTLRTQAARPAEGPRDLAYRHPDQGRRNRYGQVVLDGSGAARQARVHPAAPGSVKEQCSAKWEM